MILVSSVYCLLFVLFFVFKKKKRKEKKKSKILTIKSNGFLNKIGSCLVVGIERNINNTTFNSPLDFSRKLFKFIFFIFWLLIIDYNYCLYVNADNNNEIINLTFKIKELSKSCCRNSLVGDWNGDANAYYDEDLYFEFITFIDITI